MALFVFSRSNREYESQIRTHAFRKQSDALGAMHRRDLHCGELEKLPSKVILNSMSRARDALIISLLISVKMYHLFLFILTHFPWH